MNILDIIILICLIPAIVQGIRKGFISQVISLISIVLGIWISAKFTSLLTGWLSQFISCSEHILRLTAFVIILIGVIIGLAFLGKALETIIKLVTLQWVNKLLGGIFAVTKCVLILGILLMLFESLNGAFNFVKNSYIEDSMLYPELKWISDIVFPYIKNILTLK